MSPPCKRGVAALPPGGIVFAGKQHPRADGSNGQISITTPPSALLRYVFPYGKTGRTIENRGSMPAAPLEQLRFMKSRGLLWAGTSHPLLFLSAASFKGFNFPEGKIILEGRRVGIDKEALHLFQLKGMRIGQSAPFSQ